MSGYIEHEECAGDQYEDPDEKCYMVYEGANIEEDALVDGETSDEEDDDGYY